jgi:hypothetical protein
LYLSDLLGPPLSLLFFASEFLWHLPDPPEFTYRIGSRKVRLSFSAIDQNNHGAATLQTPDFAVFDKDVIVRTFPSFTRSDGAKLEIAMLI